MDAYINTTLSLMMSLHNLVLELERGGHASGARLGRAFQEKADHLEAVLEETKRLQAEWASSSSALTRRLSDAEDECARLRAENAALTEAAKGHSRDREKLREEERTAPLGRFYEEMWKKSERERTAAEMQRDELRWTLDSHDEARSLVRTIAEVTRKCLSADAVDRAMQEAVLPQLRGSLQSLHLTETDQFFDQLTSYMRRVLSAGDPESLVSRLTDRSDEGSLISLLIQAPSSAPVPARKRAYAASGLEESDAGGSPVRRPGSGNPGRLPGMRGTQVPHWHENPAAKSAKSSGILVAIGSVEDLDVFDSSVLSGETRKMIRDKATPDIRRVSIRNNSTTRTKCLHNQTMVKQKRSWTNQMEACDDCRARDLECVYFVDERTVMLMNPKRSESILR